MSPIKLGSLTLYIILFSVMSLTARAGSLNFYLGDHSEYSGRSYLSSYENYLRKLRRYYKRHHRRARRYKRRARRARMQDYGRYWYDAPSNHSSRSNRSYRRAKCRSGKYLRRFLPGRTLKGRSRMTGRSWRAAFYRNGRVHYKYSSGNTRWANWKVKGRTIVIAFSPRFRAYKKLCGTGRALRWVSAGSGRASSHIVASYAHKSRPAVRRRPKRLASAAGSIARHAARKNKPRKSARSHHRSTVKPAPKRGEDKDWEEPRREKRAQNSLDFGNISLPVPRPAQPVRSGPSTYLPPSKRRHQPERNFYIPEEDAPSSSRERQKDSQRNSTRAVATVTTRKNKKRTPNVAVEKRASSKVETQTIAALGKDRERIVQKKTTAARGKQASERTTESAEKGGSFFDLLTGSKVFAKSDKAVRTRPETVQLKPRKKSLASVMAKPNKNPVTPALKQKLARLAPQKATKKLAVRPLRTKRFLTGSVDQGWGAIAYTPSGQFVAVTRQKNIDAARALAARQFARLTSSRHRMMTINKFQCAAVSRDRSSSTNNVFVNRGMSLKAARQTALQRCRLSRAGKTDGCIMDFWFCADGRVSDSRL